MKGSIKFLIFIGLLAGMLWTGMVITSETHMGLGAGAPVRTVHTFLRDLFAWRTPPPIYIGDSRETIQQKLGSPLGQSKAGDIVTLFYEGGGIDLQDGRVIRIESDFAETARHRRAKNQYEAKRRVKGPLKHSGDRISQEEARSRGAHAEAVKATRHRRRAVGPRPPIKAVTIVPDPSMFARSAKPQPKKLSSIDHGLDGKQDYTVKGKLKNSCWRR